MLACVHEHFYSYTRSHGLLPVSVCTILQMSATAEEVRGWLWKNRWYIFAGATIMVVGGVVVMVYGGTIVASIGACWTALVTALEKIPIAITIGTKVGIFLGPAAISRAIHFK